MPKATNLGFGGGPNLYEQRARSRREVLYAMASGMVAEPLAGLAGLYGAATGGLDKGV